MKNWPIWLFVIGVVGIVLFAFNYQGNDNAVPLSEIFPEEDHPVDRVEYEFVGQNQEEPAKTVMKTSAEPEGLTKKSERSEEKSVPSARPREQAAAASGTASSEKPDFSEVPYTIQVLSSKKKESAETALKKIKDAGYPAYIQETEIPDRGTWYRIYIGSFRTKAQADEYLTKVRKDYEGSFVISPK